LSYYQKVEDTEASGIVYLSEQYFVREEERGKDGRDFGFTVAPSDEEGSATRAFYLATSNHSSLLCFRNAKMQSRIKGRYGRVDGRPLDRNRKDLHAQRHHIQTVLYL